MLRHTDTHTHTGSCTQMHTQPVVSPEGTQLPLKTKVIACVCVCVCVCVCTLRLHFLAAAFDVHPLLWETPVNIETFLHPPSSSWHFSLSPPLLLCCHAPWEGSSNARWRRGQPHVGSHSAGRPIWTPRSGSNLPRVKITLSLTGNTVCF